MLETSLDGVLTICQFTSLGVFYTYFLSFSHAFHLFAVRAVYSAAIGALLVYFTGNYQIDNLVVEPKTIILYGLFMLSFCSATLAACFFADGNLNEEMVIYVLPKIAIVTYFIAFYLTRIAAMFYMKILVKSGKYTDSASLTSWIVTVILYGLNFAEFQEYTKSLAITMIVFGFLYLSLAFMANEKIPEVFGILENEISKLLGFYSLQNVIRYEEHRTFACSECTTFFFRNLTNEKIAVDITFSNPDDRLTIEDYTKRYIRGRGHLRIEVKKGENRLGNDRFFVFYAKSMENLDDVNKAGFLTIQLD